MRIYQAFLRFIGEKICILCTPIITIGVQFVIKKVHLLRGDNQRMMREIYRVSFIGHREIDRFRFVEEQLDKVIGELLRTKEYVEFYVGKNGEFDTMVASAVKRGQKAYGTANSSLILVIPYSISDMDLLEQFYDEIWLPEELYKVHHKAAITKRNEWFVDNSDLLVSYITRESGGAARCQKYAEKQGLPIKNIALEEEQPLFQEREVNTY